MPLARAFAANVPTYYLHQPSLGMLSDIVYNGNSHNIAEAIAF